MRPLYFRLDGKLAVPCRDAKEWARWFQGAERQVAVTVVGELWVSTVFIGLVLDSGTPPALFETMVFPRAGPMLEHYQMRSCSWKEAEIEHRLAVAWAEAHQP